MRVWWAGERSSAEHLEVARLLMASDADAVRERSKVDHGTLCMNGRSVASLATALPGS